MTSPQTHSEKIFWVWSDRKERELSIRVQFSMSEDNGCRLYSLGRREEWC